MKTPTKQQIRDMLNDDLLCELFNGLETYISNQIHDFIMDNGERPQAQKVCYDTLKPQIEWFCDDCIGVVTPVKTAMIKYLLRSLTPKKTGVQTNDRTSTPSEEKLTPEEKKFVVLALNRYGVGGPEATMDNLMYFNNNFIEDTMKRALADKTLTEAGKTLANQILNKP